MTERKTQMRYPGGDPENGPAVPHYLSTGRPVWEEDFEAVEGTAAGILMLMFLHKISLSDIIDAIIIDQHIIGVGLITMKDQLVEVVNAHLK